jgi:hypothetical protein
MDFWVRSLVEVGEDDRRKELTRLIILCVMDCAELGILDLHLEYHNLSTSYYNQ